MVTSFGAEKTKRRSGDDRKVSGLFKFQLVGIGDVDDVMEPISWTTAREWTHKLGASYQGKEKGIYIDGHDREDVVRYRDVEFVPLMCYCYLLRCYLYVTANDDDGLPAEHHVDAFDEEFQNGCRGSLPNMGNLSAWMQVEVLAGREKPHRLLYPSRIFP